MKIYMIFQIVLCVITTNFNVNALSSEEIAEVTETCCTHGEALAIITKTVDSCSEANPPEEIEPDQLDTCFGAMKSCCQKQFKQKDECSAGMKLAPAKRCSVPKSDIGKTCCEECSFGLLTGESQGADACGAPATEEDISPTTALRKNAYYQCCKDAATKPETTTTEKKVETTTEKKKEVVKEKCQKNSCEHICNDDDGRITCLCRDGFRLQADKKTCKDINECAEVLDDICPKEGTVCHNVPGSFKCVPIKKRDVSLSCPPGFQRNVINQVCDDINECQLPRPPCPKYLCENTIGGYKCAGKPGKPIAEAIPGATTDASVSTTVSPKNDICPPGFRAGPDDECVDIDECAETTDDCQRLSQYCINTHGKFFCQDHVSKRCYPGFKVNVATGICEDIDECEESNEVCKRNEVCVNLPGAYNCKSKISTLPKLATKTCQEGTRIRPGGAICEDIDECREGSHLCDEFQNCINTYGGHECRCKSGFELDSSTGACADVDECALKLDNCPSTMQCVNVLGSFTCMRRVSTTTSTSTLAPKDYVYEYYDSEDENETIDNETQSKSIAPSSNNTPRPNTTPRPYITPRTATTPRISTTPRPTTTPRRTTPRPTTTTEATTTPRRTTTTTPRPTTTSRPTTTPSTTTTSTTHPTPSSYPYNYPGYGYNPYGTRYFTPTTAETPYTNRPAERPRPAYRPPTPTPTSPRRPESPEHQPEESEFDPNKVNCLNGYQRNENGDCVDINECDGARHVCSNLEVCQNRLGGYVCECMPGFRRDSSGWCVVSRLAATTPRTTTIRTTTARTTSTRPTTPRTTIRTTTESSTAAAPYPGGEWQYRPSGPRRHYVPPIICELGYTFNSRLGQCVDVDECATNKATCSSEEDCVNVEGGYRCVCGRRCRPATYKPTSVVPSREHFQPTSGDTNVITVGAQYGQPGPPYKRPSYSRLPDSGAIVAACPWGYKLTADKQCLDIDECARNISECGPQQKCENFNGGYACQCPAGHRLLGQDRCEDVDECAYGSPCPYNAQCVNTVGSYRCQCGEGFRNAPKNDRVCVDVDECSETPGVCQQGCANVWGGYRCYCERGYRLHTDNSTCVDVDECSEWSAARVRGRLCGGECVNVPGSYRCSCPGGYRLSEDGRSCIDLDECETGEARCAHPTDPGEVCQNTRGSYHCHHIRCPPGYRLESKHRCNRIQRSCLTSDWDCLHQPSSYSYNFITFVANIYLPSGRADLFTMHGPAWSDSVISFEMRLMDVQASHGVRPADRNCFDMRPTGNLCVVSLLCSLEGPQVAELELTMSLYQRGQFAGSAVARLIVIVSQYEF